MLPDMKARPRVAIVGAGNLGSALAVSLKRAGYVITAIVVRKGTKSIARARRLAKEVGAKVLFDSSAVDSDIVWFCVPDSQIASAAALFARKVQRRGNVVFHSSGVFTSDELDIFRSQEGAVASVHPLMTFVRGSRPSLVDVAFAVEGDRRAIRVAERIVRDLAGHAFPIRKKQKAAYHAWGVFTSPLVTALLVTSEQVANVAGVSGKAAREKAIPILRQTLANYAEFGGAAGFSGPIVRGDLRTVRKHLQVLQRRPVARDVYLALARAALEYLPARDKRQLRQVLVQEIGRGGRRSAGRGPGREGRRRSGSAL